MKRNLSILLLNAVFVLLSTGALNAQDFWEQTSGPFGGEVLSLAINPADHVFAGTFGGGLFRSTDNGDSWTEINNGLTNTLVLSIVINSAGHVFAGTEGGAFRSTDNGDSWTEINNGLTATSVLSLAINSSDHVFAGTSGGGVFRSTDNGDSWTEINNGLTATFVSSLAINSTGHIFAGTDGGGVFRSTDNGDIWTEINTGLTNTFVSSLAINSTGHVFAGTIRGGVFRSVEATISVREVAGDLPSSFRLNQNYPNPFNPETSIEYSLPTSADVSLIVYNLLGEEVAQLIYERKQAGSYTIEWDASNVASGIYLYRLQVDDFVQTRKMLLLK